MIVDTEVIASDHYVAIHEPRIERQLKQLSRVLLYTMPGLLENEGTY